MKVAMRERLARVAFELYNEGTPHLPWEEVGADHKQVWLRVIAGVASEAKRFVRRQAICDAVERRRAVVAEIRAAAGVTVVT